MVRNAQTATATGLRKSRVTQKTRLRVVRGQLDTDILILDDDEERNKVLASQGVDADDANEHHLQAVLNGNSRHAGVPGKQIAAHIPIPDAAGIVIGYETLYPAGKFKHPRTHLRFSDSVDEAVDSGLGNGFTYFLDEKDAEWLLKNNQEARGEGTSANANGLVEGSPPSLTRSGRKGTRGKGKDPEVVHAHVRVTVDEDEFELVMGLFEKITDEKFPFIHLSLDNFPTFADYENVFGAPLSAVTFASYLVPPSVPPPERLVLVAQTVYPHWKARKVEREGKRVVPQLDYDDSSESSYICFRRRDVKPVRRTRASSAAYTDKLIRLRAELNMGLDLAGIVLERERLKLEGTNASQDVWRTRCRLVDEWRAGDNKAGVSIDEPLLFDKERVVKKSKVEGLGRIILGLNRVPMGPQSARTPSYEYSPLTAHLDLAAINTLSVQGYISIQNSVRDRYNNVQSSVEREIARVRTRDMGWEDLLDLPYQAMPVPASEKLYRPYISPNLASSPSTPSHPALSTNDIIDHGESKLLPSRSTPNPMAYEAPIPPPISSTHQPDSIQLRTPTLRHSERLARSVRLRTGRGGRLHLDRRLHTNRSHPAITAERGRWPRGDVWDSTYLRDDRKRERDARFESLDWRSADEFLFEPGREGVKRHALGEEYWAHQSIYENRAPQLGKRKRTDYENESVGFEHSWHGLGLAAFTEWEKGPRADEQSRIPERRRSEHGQDGYLDSAGLQAEERTVEEIERSARVQERWRYDADVGREQEDRLLLDDFQPKFLRTKITLLDAADHDAINTDTKYLTAPVIPHVTPRASRPSSSLGEQDQMVMPSTASQRVTSSLDTKPLQMLPSNCVPTTTPPLPQGRTEQQIRRMVRQTPSASPTAAVTPRISHRMPVTQIPSPGPVSSQSSTSPPKTPSSTNGIVNDSGATVRVSSPMRQNSHTPTPQQTTHHGVTVNGFAQNPNSIQLALLPGHAHGPNFQQPATLRDVLTDHPGAQPQIRPHVQPQIPSGGNINFQMGPGNLNLKLPPTRPGQIRVSGGGFPANIAGQVAPIHSMLRPDAGTPIPPHPHSLPLNGALMTSTNDRPVSVNAHLLGRVSPLARAPLSAAPHHHSLVSLHSSPPQPRPTVPLVHQQAVGGSGQAHGYS